MSILLETWNQASALMPHGLDLGDHHTMLAEMPIDNPAPKPLPGKLEEAGNNVVGMLKTACYLIALISGLILVIFMALGFRGRSNFAKDALTHYPWVFVCTIAPGALWGILDSFS